VRALLVSLLIHAGIIAAGLIYLPKAAQVMENTPIVPVQLVALSDRTNVRAAAPDPEPEPEELPEETIEDAIEDPVSAPEPEPVAPEPEPELIDPDPVTPEPEPEPEPDPVEPEPEEEPEPVVETPETPREPEPETSSEPSLFDMLGDIERQVAQTRQDTGNPDEGDRRDSAGDADAMTATLRDLVNSHILRQRCWRMPLDAPYPEERVVTITMRLNRDGSLASPAQIDEGRTNDRNDRFRQPIRERALRAATECAPYPLPPAQYESWRLIRVNFGPNNSTQ
jgi:outer membrane biosynthesis protein TonB